jgi:hypothetical protein
MDDSAVVTTTVRVLPVNDPPIVDLDGFSTPEIDAEAYFDVGAGAALLAPNLDLEDVDNTELVAASVTLLNRPDGRYELLNVNNPTGANVSIEYDLAAGQLTLTGAPALLTTRKFCARCATTTCSTTPNAPTAQSRCRSATAATSASPHA